MAGTASAAHSRLNTSTALLGEPYGNWVAVRRDIEGVLKQRYAFRARQLRDAVDRTVLSAQSIAGDPGDCSCVAPEHVAAALCKFADENVDQRTRALNALLAGAEMELAPS